ncbi:Flp family type IVb pilin [Clostridiaceae bacterium HFYG-1003]|nr:Flp family type IVb pilin [Clostridiaceae bacterium HFYG-1003]
MDFIKNIWTEEEGQGLVEYGLIIALIAVALIAVLGFMSGGLQKVFGGVSTKLNSVTVP